MFTKKYFQDRPILFLNLVVLLGSVINILAVVLGIDTSRSISIIRYQAILGSARYSSGNVIELYSFAVFALLAAAVAIILSARLYQRQRFMSLLILWLTIIVLVFNLIVSSLILGKQ